MAVGFCCATSSAKIGPDSTATACPAPASCAITSDIRSSVSVSSPLVALTRIAPGARCGAAACMTARQPCDGIAETTSAVSRSASGSESIGLTPSGR